MPQARVVFYRDDDGSVPVLDWLTALRRRNFPKPYAKLVARVGLLAASGRELRRPVSAPLRDGIHELRAEHGHVNYRILYGYSGKDAAVLSLGITKEARVPPGAIDEAVTRLAKFKKDPERHTHAETFRDAQDPGREPEQEDD